MQVASEVGGSFVRLSPSPVGPAVCVRIELDCRAPVGVCRELENCSGWKTHTFSVRSVEKTKQITVVHSMPEALLTALRADGQASLLQHVLRRCLTVPAIFPGGAQKWSSACFSF